MTRDGLTDCLGMEGIVSELSAEVMEAGRLRAYLTVMFALPMSPLVENLMPSLVTEMFTVSPMPLRSLWHSQMKEVSVIMAQ